MSTDTLLQAFALMLIVEGMLPFIWPGGWRDAFRKMTELPEPQIRWGGLLSMAAGLALLMLLN